MTGEQFANWIRGVDLSQGHQAADAARAAMRLAFDQKWCLVWKCTGCGHPIEFTLGDKTRQIIHLRDCKPEAGFVQHGYTTARGAQWWKETQ